MIQFSSTTDILIGKSGAASITSANGFINNATISVPGHSLNEILFNPTTLAQAGSLMVSVMMSDGKTFDFPPYGQTKWQQLLDDND